MCAFLNINKGSSKTPEDFLGKVYVKNFYQSLTKEVEISPPLSFFFPSILFYRIFGRFSA
jgi:hypothetical protein